MEDTLVKKVKVEEGSRQTVVRQLVKKGQCHQCRKQRQIIQCFQSSPTGDYLQQDCRYPMSSI